MKTRLLVLAGLSAFFALMMAGTIFAQQMTLLSPDSAAVDVDQTDIVFIWATYPGTDYYRLKFDFVPTLDSLGYSYIWTDTLFNWGNIGQDETTIYWQVIAYPETGGADTSSIWFFTTDNPYPEPVLLEPSNMATDVSQPVDFFWGAVSGASLYTIQIADDPGFTPLDIFVDYVVEDTTYSYAEFEVASTYYWRVQCFIPETMQWDRWSEVWSFTIDCPPPDAPQLLAPPMNTIYQGITEATFQWSSVGAMGSELGFYQVEFWNGTSYDINTSTTSYTIDFYNPGVYHWRVRAYHNLCGFGEWSDTGTLTFACATPDPPVLLSPLPGAVDQSTPVTLSWEAAPGVIEYQVQMDNHAGFGNPEIEGLTSMTDYQATGLDEGVEYFWRVRADYGNDCGYGDWSALGYFTTVCPQLAAPVQTGPENGMADIMMPFYVQWNEVPEASSYRIQIDDNADFTGPEVDEQSSVNSYLVTGLSQNVPYWWRLQALDECGWGSWTGGWSFSPGANYTGGDANCDGQANVGDAVYLINYIFKGGPAPCNPIH